MQQSEIQVFFTSDSSMDQQASMRKKKHEPESRYLSRMSNNSMDDPIGFSHRPISTSQNHSEPEPSCVSRMSDNSMDDPIGFSHRPTSTSQNHSEPEPSCVSRMSDNSMDDPIGFSHRQTSDRRDQRSPDVLYGLSLQQHQTQLDSTLMMLESNIISFVQNQLKRVPRLLNSDYLNYFEDDEVLSRKEDKSGIKEAFLKITLHFLRKMGQKELAECLESRICFAECRRKLKLNLQRKFQCVFDGVAKTGMQTRLNEIYTELYITEGGPAEVNTEHEIRQIEAECRKPTKPETSIIHKDIFKAQDRPIRTVLTKGVAGIGKTVFTQKFTLDWAENKINQDIDFMLPFTFRELNILKEKSFSLVELIHHFFTETKKAGICSFEGFQVAFIFDGLDECRLPLDFHNNETLTDETKPTSVDVLLTNLISGNLLPFARLWITTRPAAANQIPSAYVSMVTEVKGFTDSQKQEYFRKRFRDKEQAETIISHIKKSRSVYIMCHIPVFCWISATVVENMFNTIEDAQLPKTLTEMYIHFLVVQTKLKNVKYDGGQETDPHWNQESRRMIESLGKLAFEQLKKGNLIFYESDLIECNINIREASVCSGVFTQIFKEESGLYQDKVFCFVHLSLQEFLAALHVHVTFTNSDVNLLAAEQARGGDKPELLGFYQRAVDEALKSPNGHLDLFLRFLLGLSLQNNQTRLQGFLKRTDDVLGINQKTAKFIKQKISEDVSPDRSINLFHCLNELNDCSLVAEIQQQLRSGHLSTSGLSPAQWSALGFMLLSSENDLDVFDLKKYSASEEALLRLMPVVKASNKALLSGCQLSERSCEALSLVLSSQSSSLRELNLSNNDLGDLGARLLSNGLKNPHCHLETLSLSGCLITEEGYFSLASALGCNPTHLRELDLSYNHPGDSGVKILSAGLENKDWGLETLRIQPGGDQWLKPGLRKYFCELSLDTNSAHRDLQVSECVKKVTNMSEDQCHPDHPDRFEKWPQLLCDNDLTGRCYWEVEWSGGVYIAVSYKRIGRTGDGESEFGWDDQSWSLSCSDHGYSVFHNNTKTLVSSSVVSNRAAVYLDCPAGTLSFYTVSSSDMLIHLHTYNTTFTQPLYPGFTVWWRGSSVSLCDL